MLYKFDLVFSLKKPGHFRPTKTQFSIDFSHMLVLAVPNISDNYNLGLQLSYFFML